MDKIHIGVLPDQIKGARRMFLTIFYPLYSEIFDYYQPSITDTFPVSSHDFEYHSVSDSWRKIEEWGYPPGSVEVGYLLFYPPITKVIG